MVAKRELPPPIDRREVALVVALAIVLAGAMNWSVVVHLSSAFPASPRDPLLEAWSTAWTGHALIHHPLRFWDGNAFWPLGDSLAFSDSLAGYAPAALVGNGLGAALTRYNVLFLSSYALAFGGAYLLARELGARRAGAACAGCAFAWTPWRVSEASHLHVLSSGGVPLSLFLLVRGWRRGSVPTILAGWAVAAWQVTLGWNIGLPFVYLLTAMAIGASVLVLAGRLPLPPRPALIATVAGGAAAAAIMIAFALPYLRVLDRHPEARRTPDVLYYFSPPIRGLVAASAQEVVWGATTARVRRHLRAPGEQELFPGLAILLLATLGVVAGLQDIRLRLGLLAVAVSSAILSLGFSVGGGRLSYRLLYDHAPGWQGLRTPGRLATFTALALALLAAAGVDRLATSLRRRPALHVAVPALVLAAVLLEGYGRIAFYRPPAPVPRAAALAQPQLYLPFGYGFNDDIYMYWSTDGFPRIANGWSGFEPRFYTRLASNARGFPDEASVARLRAVGIRTVILDRRLARGTAWAFAARKPTAGLHVDARRVGRFVVFDLGRS